MSFTPRLTRPTAGNKYYIRKADGGYSNAIKGSPTDSQCNVLSNCVGYAYGRFNEIGNYGSCKYLCPVNAENFIKYKGSCEVGDTPKLGACIVWQKGATLSGDDGAGHVAIVEQIIDENTIVTSESGYGCKTPFWTKTRKKGSDGNWGQSSSYKFLGFIYNPAVKDETQTVIQGIETVTPTTTLKVGDIVTYTGTTHYTSANATTAKKCVGGVAKITAIYQLGKSKHPYHLVRVAGQGATVYGWVDAEYIKELKTETTVTETVWEPKVGDVVKFTGTTHYVSANSTLGVKCKSGEATITKIYQLGKSKHPYHLVKVKGKGSTVYGWVDADTLTKI